MILPSWIVLMLVRYVWSRSGRPQGPGCFMLRLFYEFCLYWLEPLGSFDRPDRRCA